MRRRPARVRDGRRHRGSGRRPLFVSATRRRDEHGRGRPAAGARRTLPRARGLVPRRRGVRRLRRARPSAGAEQLARHRAAPTRSRSTRTSGSTSRTSAAACSSATASSLRNAFVITPDYLREAAALEQRGELLRPRAAAQPHGAGVQGLGLVAVLRPRRVPPRDRPHPRPRRARAAAHRGERPARARRRAVARHRLLPAGLRGRDEELAQREARRGARGERPRARLLDAPHGPLRDPHVHPEPHERRARTSTACSTFSRRPTSEAETTPPASATNAILT